MKVKEIYNKSRSVTADYALNRPVALLSTIGAIRDILFGIGFILGLSQIRQTLLYHNYDALIHHVSGPIAGWLLLAIGLLVGYAALKNKTKIVQLALRAQAYVWLFSAVMYFLNREIILGMVFGIFFSVPAGYLAFYYKYGHRWTGSKNIFHDRGLDDES